MSARELEIYEMFLWDCMEQLPRSALMIAQLNSIHREVEKRMCEELRTGISRPC
jgi:hypothetical protein